jgi:aminoglycoside phosphotransferase (APT) family kinase protein
MVADRSRQDSLILNMLKDHGLLTRPDGWNIEQAAGGLNSRVYFVREGGGTPVYTVRLAIPTREWMLRREADVINSIDRQCACAPETVILLEHVDLTTQPVLVHPYAAGTTAPLGSVSESQLRSLGACLATIHAHTRDHYTIWPALKPRDGTRAAAFLDRLAAMRRYTTFTDAPGVELKQRIERLYSVLSGITLPGTDWDETRFSLLHGDTSIGNIIWDGDAVALIDWEYARDSDPAEEIAYLLTEQPLDPDSTGVLFQSYIQAGGEAAAIERAEFYAPLTALDSALWWGDYHLTTGTSSIRDVDLHLGRAEAAMAALDQ